MSKADPLTPYSTGRAGRRFRPFSLLFMILYSFGTGAAVALLPPQLLFLLATPLFIAIPIIFWLLPDGGEVPEKLLGTLMLWFLGATALWPSYLAIDLPGLPWITPTRIAMFSLLIVGLFSFSTSSKMRGEIAETFREIKWLRTAFWAYWAMTVITLPLSTQPAFSLNKWVNNQIYWTFVFFIGLWLARRSGFLPRVAKLLVVALIIISLILLEEVRRQQLPWANSIPSFLKIDDNYLPILLGTQARFGDNLYRARGTFTTSLVFAEFSAILYPLLIHFAINAKSAAKRFFMLMAMALVVVAMFFTHSRSATIGFILAMFVYGGFALFRQWRRDRSSLVPIATLAVMPIIAGAILVLAIVWPRLHNLTFGGGAQQPSTIARQTQWEMGRPKILANPIGHGVSRAGETLGFVSPGGQLTIDTYYLSLLLDVGVVGFTAFLAMFFGQLIVGLRVFLKAENADELLAGPITIGMLNFIVIKAVSSGEFFSPLAFLFLGFLFALAWRQRLRIAADAGVSSPALASFQAPGRIVGRRLTAAG